jgi:hypothetical protein
MEADDNYNNVLEPIDDKGTAKPDDVAIRTDERM